MQVLSRRGLLCVWGACAALYGLIAVHAASLWPRTSDQAGYFLAGVEAARGNWRLHGWVLTPPDFWTSDIALSALLSTVWRLLGRPEASPFLLQLQPALTWTALVATVLALIRVRLPGLRDRVVGTLVALALFGVPLMRTEIAYFVTLSAIHLGTLIYGLWAFHHAARFLETGRRSRLLLSAGLLWLGVLGDPLLQVVGTLPLLLFCAFLLWRRQDDGPAAYGTPLLFDRARALGLATLAAGVLAPLTLALNRATGGFSRESLAMNFARWDDLGTNISVTLHCLLQLFGTDASGRAVTASVPELLRFLLVVICGVVVWRAMRRPPTAWRAGGTAVRMDFFVPLLVLAAGLDLASLLLSDRVALDGRSVASVRYLFPLWAALTVVSGLLCARHARIGILAALCVGVTVAANEPLLSRSATGILLPDDREVLELLLKEEPPVGIGSWWASSGLEVASWGRVTVLPAVTGPNGQLVPFEHIHRRFSFDVLKGRPFFVLVPLPSETYDEAAVLRTFGPPERRRTVGRFAVLHYAGSGEKS